MNRELVDQIKEVMQSFRRKDNSRNSSSIEYRVCQKMEIPYQDIESEIYQATAELIRDSPCRSRGSNISQNVSVACYMWLAKNAVEFRENHGWKSVPRERWASVAADCERSSHNKRGFHRYAVYGKD